MRSDLYHVRCGKCDACQEYLADPPSGPLCVHARALVRLDRGDHIGVRTRDGLRRVGWAGAHGGISDRGRSALRRAAEAARWAEVARTSQ
jgi:hypothetical protein